MSDNDFRREVVKETEEDKLLRKIKEGRISFLEVAIAYTKYLETQNEQQRELVVDLSVLLESYKNKGMWQGTKQALEEKYKKTKELVKVFKL